MRQKNLGRLGFPRGKWIFLARNVVRFMTIDQSMGMVYLKDGTNRWQVRHRFGSRLIGKSHSACVVALAVYMTGTALSAPRNRAADERMVEKTVSAYFASQPGYTNGDLITRSQIEKVLAKIVSGGLKLPDAASIAKQGLPDDSFMARELSTPDGRRFMRKLAQHANSFSYLDRLSTIPRGQQTIRDLVRAKDGDKMIEYMATTKGGQNLGAMMSQARGGVDLNKPTGRIYTESELLAALKTALAKNP